MFIEPCWNIKERKWQTKPKEHKLKTWTSNDTGSMVKAHLEHGFNDAKIVLGDNVSIDGIIDYIDYQCTYGQYEDENVVILTKIECV